MTFCNLYHSIIMSTMQRQFQIERGFFLQRDVVAGFTWHHIMSYKHYQYLDVGVFVYRRTLCSWCLPCCFVPYTGGGFYSGGHKCVICIFAAVPAKEKCYLPVSFTSAPLPNLYLFATILSCKVTTALLEATEAFHCSERSSPPSVKTKSDVQVRTKFNLARC